MNLGEKIELLLKTTAMTKVELSRRLGLKDSSVVSHWVKNRFKPDRDNVAKLSNVFEKPISYFTDDKFSYLQHSAEDESTEKKIYDLLSSLPQTGHIGVISEVTQEYFSIPYYNQPEEFLPVMLESRTSAPFALKITDSQACPWGNSGEYVIIVPAGEVANGKTALIKIDGLCAIKKIHKTKTAVIVEDFDKTQKKYKPADVEVLGRVLAFYRKS